MHHVLSLGSSESRRLFEQSMKRGYVDMYADKMLLYGSAGVGKTCTMKIVAGEKPPDVRDSTPVATRPVIMYKLQKMGGKWRKYVSQDRMKLCARISKTTLGQEVIKALTKSKPDVKEAGQQAPDGGSEERTSTVANHQKPARVSARQSENPTLKTKPSTASPQRSVNPDVLQVIHDVLDEMFQLIDECPETEEPLSYIHKLLVSDCGGQPQFHELLPIFLHRMSLILFVFKLSEDFTSRPMIEYYEEGKALGTPYESDLTTEQLIKQGLQSLHSHQSSKDGGKDDDAPQIVMVGTHKDEESKCGESRETKNQKLREMLLPTFEKEIIYYQPGTDQVLFPMNAKCPGEEEEDMAQAIVSKFSTENRLDKRQLPLQWLGFEIMLEEITLRLKRGILSRNECLEVAHRLHLDESALDAALIYLDELSLVFYYPEILPEVVFTDPQVLLDKISELVKAHHDKLTILCSGEDWQKFFCHALVTVEFLQQATFKKHYVSGLFEPEQLAMLYRKLLIFADFSKGKFFVPSLLRMLSAKEVSARRLPFDCLVAPLVLHFPDGPPRRGIFCALISFLTSPENHFPCPWKLKMPDRSVTPDCLYRNCIQFMIPDADTPCSVTVVDTLLQFEVHVNISEQPESDFCSTIKRAIYAGLQKANLTLGYTNSTPSFAFLCPCGVGGPHPAKIGKKSWICTFNTERGRKFSPSQLMWLNEPTIESNAGIIQSIFYNVV